MRQKVRGFECVSGDADSMRRWIRPHSNRCNFDLTKRGAFGLLFFLALQSSFAQGYGEVAAKPKLGLATTWQDKVVGSEMVPDMARVATHELALTSSLVRASPARVEIVALERLLAGPARANIIERTTVRAADGGNAVGAVLGAINVINPVAWALNNSFEGVDPTVSAQQEVTPQKTRTVMRFLSDATPLPGRTAQDFSHPAATREIRITSETPKFIVELTYTLDKDGKLTLPVKELIAELSRYGYVVDSSALALTIDGTDLPAVTSRLSLPPQVLSAAAK